MNPPLNEVSVQMGNRTIFPAGQFEGKVVFAILVDFAGNVFNDVAVYSLGAQFVHDHSFGEFLGSLARFAPGSSELLIVDQPLLLQSIKNGVRNVLSDTALF